MAMTASEAVLNFWLQAPSLYSPTKFLVGTLMKSRFSQRLFLPAEKLQDAGVKRGGEKI